MNPCIFWHSSWHIFYHSFWHIFSHSFWHIFWHSFWHLSDISFDILSDISSDILSDLSFDMISDISSDISFWHIFCHSFWQIFWHNTWGPARHTELTGSRLGSGTPHWTRRIAVGVQHATLNSQDRGWGPARHTELTGSQLRSDMPHWTHRIATGQGDGRRGGGEEGGEGGGEETDIKSNNPHLTGGEIDRSQKVSKSLTWFTWFWTIPPSNLEETFQWREGWWRHVWPVVDTLEHAGASPILDRKLIQVSAMAGNVNSYRFLTS